MGNQGNGHLPSEEELGQELAALHLLKKNSRETYGSILQGIALRKRRRMFRRAALSAAAAVLAGGLILALYRQGSAPDGPAPLLADTLEEEAHPVLVTEKGQCVSLDRDKAYALVLGEGAEKAPAETKPEAAGREDGLTPAAAGRTVTRQGKQTVFIPKGYTYHIEFDDGSLAYVNSGSNIRFPETFKGQERRTVEVSGECYFMVAHDDRPFMVKAGGLELTVYGTEFNVNTNKGGIVETILVTGSLGVKAEGKDAPEILLKPRQMLTYDLPSGSGSTEDIDPADYLAWMKGDFSYSNESFFHLLDEIEAHYGIGITCREGMPDQEVSINLSRKLGYLQIMEILEQAFDVKFEKTGQKDFICK